MPPLNLTPPKTVDFSQVSTVKNVNLGNQYGVGGQGFSTLTPTNSTTQTLTPAVGALFGLDKAAQLPLSVTSPKVGLLFGLDKAASQPMTITGNPQSGLPVAMDLNKRSDRRLMRRYIRSQRDNGNIARGINAWAAVRNMRADLNTNGVTWDSTGYKIPKNSLLLSVSTKLLTNPFSALNSNATLKLNSLQNVGNYQVSGVTQNAINTTTQNEQVVNLPVLKTPSNSERFNTNQQFGQMSTNYDKYGGGSSWKDYLTRVQNSLIEAGYDVGSTGADGMWGDNTSTAWDKFIRDHNAIDGENTITNLLSGKYKVLAPSNRNTYTGSYNLQDYVSTPTAASTSDQQAARNSEYERAYRNQHLGGSKGNSYKQLPLVPRIKNFVNNLFSTDRTSYTSTSETVDGKTVYVDPSGNKYISNGAFGGYTRISRNGGILKALHGALLQDPTPFLTRIMSDKASAMKFALALGMSLDELVTASADPETSLLLEQIAQKVMTQLAKHGAKLEYISFLRGKCPEGQELVYFAKGGKICSACMGKKMEDGGEAGYMKSFRDRQKKKQMEKCGGKMKKGK